MQLRELTCGKNSIVMEMNAKLNVEEMKWKWVNTDSLEILKDSDQQ